jgi:hypothetical protein
MKQIKYFIFLIIILGCNKEDEQNLVDVCGELDQTTAMNCAETVCPPILLSPENCSSFDFYPRDMTHTWESNSTADSLEYEIERQYSWKDQDNFGRWDDESSAGSSKIVQDTFLNTGWTGAQPGRWRVRTISNQDTSSWSVWSYFEFLI